MQNFKTHTITFLRYKSSVDAASGNVVAIGEAQRIASVSLFELSSVARIKIQEQLFLYIKRGETRAWCYPK